MGRDVSLAVGRYPTGLDSVLAIGSALEVVPDGVQPDHRGDRDDEHDHSDNHPLPTLRHWP